MLTWRPSTRTRTSSSRGTSPTQPQTTINTTITHKCDTQTPITPTKPTPTHSIQVSSGYELFTRAKYFGGDFDDYGASLIADPSDPTAVYGIGTSLSPLFISNTGPLELLPDTAKAGRPHAWVVRMDGPSSSIMWARSLGSIVYTNGTAPKLAVHGPSKALYVTGASFLAFGGQQQPSTILRLDTGTGDVVWARSLPQAWAVAVQQATGQPFVAGCVWVVVWGFGG